MATIMIPTKMDLIDLTKLSLLMSMLLVLISTVAFGQNYPDYVCSQSTELRDSLIAEAETAEYNVLHIEFVNNVHLSGRKLFRKSGSAINEGDIFTRRNLETAMKRVSKIKSIYPLTIENIEIKLNRADKSIDILFCLKEKPK